MDLQTPLDKASRVYKMYSRRLVKLGILKVEDFIYHFPFRYEDYSLISKIAKIQAGETVTVKGKVIEIKNEYTRRGKKLQKAKVADESGVIDVIWFNQPYLTRSIHKDDIIYLSGKVELNIHKLVFMSPEHEVEFSNDYRNIHTGRLVPVYPETYGVSSKWLRRQTYKILNDHADEIVDFLPSEIINDNKFFNLKESLLQIHFPDNLENVEKAKERLSFDELFLLQLSSISKRSRWKKMVTSNKFDLKKYKSKIEEFISSLPFKLTSAQNKAIGEIFIDLSVDKAMNRLLEGDVGSGKTVVSAIAMYLAYLNGYQSVLMAPTEILALQHYKTISDLLAPFGLKVGLATGSKKLSIINSQFSILVGTHAVLHGKIEFNNLGLIVIDEQQRFGVEQRALIRKKGNNPHFLTMTATPIPRTVALTMFGDLDLSYLNQMPIGRKRVKTWLIPPSKRNNAYEWIKKEIAENKSQAFIICPFIEESENMITVRAATVEYEKLKKENFPKLNLGLLHGKMKAKEKDDVLAKFRNKELDILVSTPVVEVGIDIPNATVIMIEASDRFGLAQLHQLRGRVGRGDKQSYCLLFTESVSEKTIQRLKALETKYIGAELAELDLKLRGPGELHGTMQHGIPKLKIASFSNFELIEKVRKVADKIYPQISKYPLLSEKIESLTSKEISPD